MNNIDDDASRKPQSFLLSVSWACSALPLNATVRALENDIEGQFTLAQKFRELGQERFINLARKSTESMETLSLYAGDGVVFKVMPTGKMSHIKEPVLVLPPITEDVIETKENRYVIQSFPYVPRGNVEASDIEFMREKLMAVGLKFSANDDSPRNVHRIPDKEGTLVGVDADMTSYIYGNDKDAERIKLSRSWNEYISEIYPVYKTGKIPHQSEATDFNLKSIHDDQKSSSMDFWGKFDVPESAVSALTQATQNTVGFVKIKAVIGSLFKPCKANDSDLAL